MHTSGHGPYQGGSGEVAGVEVATIARKKGEKLANGKRLLVGLGEFGRRGVVEWPFEVAVPRVSTLGL